jgi:hypothetical protein
LTNYQKEHLNKLSGFIKKDTTKDEYLIDKEVNEINTLFQKCEEIIKAFGNREPKSQEDLFKENIKLSIIGKVESVKREYTENQKNYLNSK